MAEHHSMPGIASAATWSLAFVGSQTSTSASAPAAIMLPNHSPLVIAEQFGTSKAFSRAVSTSGSAALRGPTRPRLMRCGATWLRRDEFPSDVVELMGYFRGGNGTCPRHPRRRPRSAAVDPRVEPVRRAARGEAWPALRLRLALRAANDDGSDRCVPASVRAVRPAWRSPMSCSGSTRSSPTATRRRSCSRHRCSRHSCRCAPASPIQLPPPRAGFADELPLDAKALLRSVLSVSAIGSPATAARQINEFVARTKPDELMVTARCSIIRRACAHSSC